MARKLQEINAGSMADIAFMLLIFFLVATTMDVDTGVFTKLPPIPEQDQEQETQVNKRNIMVVLINRNDDISLGGEVVSLDVVRERAKEFIANPTNAKHLPEKKVKQLKYFGSYPCTKAIISLQNDRSTTYEIYLAVRNELTAAYRELRDELCMRKWGKKFADVSEEQEKDIRQIFPRIISEAEPKNIKK
jgi:biopolymer transport protein ExbD